MADQPTHFEKGTELDVEENNHSFQDEQPTLGSDGGKDNSFSSWFQNNTKRVPRLPRRYRLFTEKDALNHSITSVRLAIMASAINTKMLNPNYPIMVTPGAHPDSFPNTNPFDYNSATYFLPLCSLLGVAIASIFLGQISDRVGRKKVILLLSIISAIGSVVKYFTRSTFWGFCIGQIAFGFFLGNLPVGMAYVGDVFTSQKEKEKELGLLVSFFVMGNSGGGIIAILMNESGLFAPLWVGAAIMALSAMYTSWYMIEPGDYRLASTDDRKSKKDKEVVVRPETIDHKSLTNIVLGAVADNFGSTALFPLCLSPLAVEQFLGTQMTYTGYQWLSVMVAGMVVPSTIITPPIFRILGVAGTCVLGNTLTALVTFALLMIGNLTSTTGTFAAFVIVLYGGFPFTVFSQLTTGPMLDVIAPEDKIGYVQGLNNAAMNFGMAIAPWVFGLLADATSANTAIWTGIGISIGAALINTPLMFDERFGRTKPPQPSAKRILSGEDADIVEKALAGEFVDPELLYAVNVGRAKKGQAILVPKVKPYEEDKGSLDELYGHAEEVYRFRMEMGDRMLEDINDPNSSGDAGAFAEYLNKGLYGNEEVVRDATVDLGKWIGDYLLDGGYNPHTSSLLIKQMMMEAFPRVRDGEEYTPENLEDTLLRQRRLMNTYVSIHEKKQRNYTFSKVLGSGEAPVFYS